jgi:hypothetical protein
VVNIGSESMADAVWIKLAARANVLLQQDDVDAIVVTHGTDTLEETGYFSLRKGRGLVDAPGRRLVGVKGNSPS